MRSDYVEFRSRKLAYFTVSEFIECRTVAYDGDRYFHNCWSVEIQSFKTHGKGVDDEDTTVPKPLFVILDKERLERVGDLIAHVRVGEVETGQNDSLELLLGPDVLVHQVTHEHVHEDHVRWVDERNVLRRKKKIKTSNNYRHFSRDFRA